jgi:mono/diheme cytochrome c family protein
MLLATSSSTLLATAAPTLAVDRTRQIDEGRYISRLGDCGACHTRPGGAPFAGGLPIATPFGAVMSSNITPDRNTGIGAWSDEDFYRAVTDGIGRNGEYLYPAMPFTSFTKMTRSDVAAVKAYLFSLPPVHAPQLPSNLAFPFDMRWTMFAWRVLYFHRGVYRPNPKRSAQWNRGAYLVTGAGHCGECHSPRNILGATESGKSLAGGKDGRWLAPNISADRRWGLGAKTVHDIVTFLKTGEQKSEGVAIGPMAQVVHDSLRYISTADLRAIAVFLKSAAARSPRAPEPVASRNALARGRTQYLHECAKCHQSNGRGFAGVVPNLTGNAAVTSVQPENIINAMLGGLRGTGTRGTMPGFANVLSDQDIADVANYVRAAWGNRAPTNATPAMVARLHRKLVSNQR